MTNKQRIALVRKMRQHLRDADGFNPDGVHYKAVLHGLGELEREFLPKPGPVNTAGAPALGPILKGGKSLLLQDCTHLTSGVDRTPGRGRWPAFDDMGDPGTVVVAPENLIITDDTSGAQGGDAFYARGDSGIEYWVAHITRVPPQGTRFSKGTPMTTVSSDHPRPHVHLAVNAWRILGRHLTSHDNYTHGAPLIGAQLARV